MWANMMLRVIHKNRNRWWCVVVAMAATQSSFFFFFFPTWKKIQCKSMAMCVQSGETNNTPTNKTNTIDGLCLNCHWSGSTHYYFRSKTVNTVPEKKKKSKEYIRYYDCGGRNVRPAVNLDFDTFGLFPKEEEWRWAQWKWQANGRHRERPQEHTWSRVIFVRREPAYAINRPDFGGHKIQFFPFFSLSLNCFPIGRKLSTE